KPVLGGLRNDYSAPETEIQKQLCQAFEKVLGLENVGIHDDFYDMGGDSLSSIELIVESGLPDLNSAQIFRGRTPEKIEELYLKDKEVRISGGDPDERNAEELQKAHPLTTEQLYMVDYQLYTPNSTMYNLFSMMKVDKEVFDMDRMAQIMKECIAHYPALLTTYFWNDDGDLMQRYTPEVLEDIHVEHLSEFEFRYVKDVLVYPFKIVGGRLYRCRVFETEKAGYIFFDVHHSVFDGTSMKVFMGSVGKAYLGMPLEPDYYYLMLKERQDVIETDFYRESREYFENRYNGIAWSGYPRTDHTSRNNELGELIVELGIEQAQMKAVEKAYRISRNEFFITVGVIAISIYNGVDDIKLSWNYNGRDSLQLMNTVGLLFRELPIGVRLKDDLTLRDVLADVHEQVQKGIEHSCYPYVDRNSHVAEEESAYLLYQQDIRDMGGMEGFDIQMIDIRQNQAASQTILDMEILDGEEGLQLMIDFAASWYEEESIEKFKDIYIKLAHEMVTHHSQKD
ncbi:MAG: hypothetical protein IKX76_07290, partial [Eubacterium sp.]|nr:hypothetical protein [Eubacterium sp.]